MRPITILVPEFERDLISSDDPESKPGVAILRSFIPVREIRNDEYRFVLKNAIAVYLDADEQHFVAMHDDSRIGGVGTSEHEALIDFENTFINIFMSYRNSQDTLSLDAKKYLQSLEKLLSKIEKLHNR
jgi:hypothetical protein